LRKNMHPPLKVAHVVMSLNCGGLERIVLDLVREGRKVQQDVSVISMERPGPLSSQVAELGGTLVCLNKPLGVRPGLIWTLKGVLEQLRPDVLHTHQIGSLFYAGLAARAARVPLVVHTEHGKLLAGRWRQRWLGWLAAHLADRFFCVTQDVAQEVTALRVVPGSKVHVVPNGIDTARFAPSDGRAGLRVSLGIPPGVPVIGTIGRLTEVKCQDVLLRGFARLRTEVPDAHLVVVGDGPLLDTLRQLAATLALREAVHFPGYQAQPERYLQLMDVFALTSRSEGMPLAVLEAWAAGVPVVASRVGGLPEMVDEGGTGLLFPAGDDVALADAFLELVREPGRARQMGEAGRRHVRSRSDVSVMANSYQRHYLELLAQRGKTARRAASPLTPTPLPRSGGEGLPEPTRSPLPEKLCP
jgi:glycosyltransferase involved in cell wall biosynthesis